MQGCTPRSLWMVRHKSPKGMDRAARTYRKIVSWALIGLGGVGSLSATGCSREYYRKDADAQANYITKERQNDPRWVLPDRSVYGDPRARYYDPNDPDRPPMPPDDPASHEMMHCVYGMRGYKKWHQNGELTQLENPDWRSFLGEFMEKTDDGVYVLNLNGAVQIALLNSPRYQTNVENLYLSSLDVAFERFRFDTQFFLGNTTNWAHLAGPLQSSSVLTTNTTGSAAGSGPFRGGKLLPTGGEFLAQFANVFVWQFAGADRNTRADSLLSFTFFQPLLRRGGREVVLERLTLAERSLLANVRQMDYYRQSFLIDVAMGTGNVAGPRRQGGFLGDAGLSGFTGTGTGGFAGVGEASGQGRIGGAGGTGGGAGGTAGAGFAGGVAGNVGGLIGLAQQGQQIRNRKSNLDLQLENLARMEELFAAGRIGSFQVDQFRQNVQTTRSQYLQALNDYARAIELYLITTLGLPPDIPVRIDESQVAPFQFTDPKLAQLRARVNQLTERVRIMEDPDVETLRSFLNELQSVRGQIDDSFEAVKVDFRRLEAVENLRLQGLADEHDRKEFLDEVQKLHEQFKSLENQVEAIFATVNALEKQLRPEERKNVYRDLVAQYEALSDLLLELNFNQAGVMLEAVLLPPVELNPESAFQIARSNRLDMMNQRAEVVDQWRLIAFNANRLESDFDIQLNGGIGTIDRNIVKFSEDTGSFTASLRFDTPITRLGERNQYRQSLIDYQRVRRDYLQFEDQVMLTLRNTLRSLGLFTKEIELRRQAMRIAIRQMDFNQARLKEPPRVGAAAGQQGDPVRDLLGAFSDFLETQNGVMNTVLTYQALRMILYRDLGIVAFDERGMWIDEPLDAALERSKNTEVFVPPPCPILVPSVAVLNGVDKTPEEDAKIVTVALTGSTEATDANLPTSKNAPNGGANRPKSSAVQLESSLDH